MTEINEQIEEWNVPTRPAKSSDHEPRKFSGQTVELDAMAPDRLLSFFEDKIIDLIDADAWAKEQAAEKSEREILLQMAGAA
jgi:hypothetical protein